MDITLNFACNFHTFVGFTKDKNDNKRTSKECHINNSTDSSCECLNIMRYCNVRLSVVTSLVATSGVTAETVALYLSKSQKEHSFQSRNMLQRSVRRQGILLLRCQSSTS